MPSSHPITVPHIATPAVIAPTPAPARPKAPYFPPPLSTPTQVAQVNTDPLAAMYVTPALTPEERKALSPSALARRLFDQLADTIVQVEDSSEPTPVVLSGSGSQYKFYGAPRASLFAGLCQAPMFVIDLVDAADGRWPQTPLADRPSRAAFSRGALVFKAQDMELMRQRNFMGASLPAHGSACSQLRDLKGFFAAPDILAARLGALLLEGAVTSARGSEALPFALSCTGDAACSAPQALLASLGVDAMAQVAVNVCPGQSTTANLCVTIQACDNNHLCKGLEGKRVAVAITLADAGLAALLLPETVRVKEIKLVVAPIVVAPAKPPPATPEVRTGYVEPPTEITIRS